MTTYELDAEKIIKALIFTGWNKGKAAAILGMSRATLNKKIKKYNIKP